MSGTLTLDMKASDLLVSCMAQYKLIDLPA